MQEFGISVDFLINLTKNLSKSIQWFFGFSFRRFDHQGFIYDQWEIDGWRIKSKIDQPFSDVKRPGSATFLVGQRNDEFVLNAT